MWKESRRQLILRGPAGDYAVLLSSCSLPRWGQIAGQSVQGDRRLGSQAAARGHPPRGYPRHDRCDAAQSRERPGREAGQEGEEPDEREHTGQNHRVGRGRKRNGTKALTASPNPQWTEYEMQSVDEWIARQDVKLNRLEAIRRLVELGLKAKK